MASPTFDVTPARIESTYDAVTVVFDVSRGFSVLEVTARHRSENDTAIIALVQEAEPAFGTVFKKHATTNFRQDAAKFEKELDHLETLQKRAHQEGGRESQKDHQTGREGCLKERTRGCRCGAKAIDGADREPSTGRGQTRSHIRARMTRASHRPSKTMHAL